MIEIFLIIAAAIAIVAVSRSKDRVEPQYIEPDLDDGLKLIRKRMGDGLEEE